MRGNISKRLAVDLDKGFVREQVESETRAKRVYAADRFWSVDDNRNCLVLFSGSRDVGMACRLLRSYYCLE